MTNQDNAMLKSRNTELKLENNRLWERNENLKAQDKKDKYGNFKIATNSLLAVIAILMMFGMPIIHIFQHNMEACIGLYIAMVILLGVLAIFICLLSQLHEPD